MTERISEVVRNTNETKIRVRVNLDGTGQGTLNTGIPFLDHMIDQIKRHGLFDIDIECDGMGTGVNIEATKALAKAVRIPVIASGGVASLTDIENLLAIKDCEIYGVIIGRALYTGAILLEKAIKVSKLYISQN